MMEARDERRLLRFQKQMAGYKLLIIDELGFVPLSKTGAELLFELVSQRYERGSTLITSNLPFDEWTETFGSERLTGALLDRLTHHVSILEMNGDSYRLAQSRARKSGCPPRKPRRCRRETLVGLRPPDVPRLQRQVAYFCAAQWPDFAPPLTCTGFCAGVTSMNFLQNGWSWPAVFGAFAASAGLAVITVSVWG